MEKSIHQLKVTLKGSRPPIWRRLKVPSDITLAKLHHAIQNAMGWQNCHLHQFEAHGVSYAEPHPDDWKPVRDERRTTLRRIAPHPGDAFDYEYDFGDSWDHRIVVEMVMAREPGTAYPVCVGGKRACPPEDSGGVWGYARLLEALADPSDPDHHEYVAWAGGRFDPAAFDLELVNALLFRAL